MGYTPNLNDPNSPYYYGTDSTYQVKPSKEKKKPARPVISSELLANDPELMTQSQFNVGRDVQFTPSKPVAPQIRCVLAPQALCL